MGHGYDEDPYLFHIRFKSPVRANWRCRGCVVIIIITTVGDAEVTVMMRLEMQRMRSLIFFIYDWCVVIIIITTVGDAEDAR